MAQHVPAAAHALELVSTERLLDALRMLHATPSRAGDEAALARAADEWGRAAAPAAAWRVDPLSPTSANLVSTYPAGDGRCEVLLYTHLDTSLSGEPALDLPLTGVAARAPERLEHGGGRALGLGLAVSKAPAACALVAYVALVEARAELGVPRAPVGVLLSAGGTHRAPSGGFPATLPQGIDQGLGGGVEAALRGGLGSRAVINVKGGATGVLREEPGCLLLRLEIRGRMAPVPLRGGDAGAAVQVARVAQLVEEWRQGYAATRRGRGREIAADAGVGAIESGLPYKPDILPAAGNVYVYVATLPEESPETVTAELMSHLQERMPDLDPEWEPSSLCPHVYGHQPGAGTEEASPVVQAARAAWERAFGPGSSEVRDYAGSTDGVIFRRHGIDTARMGVTARAVASNPTVDEVALDDMLAVARVYVEVLEELT